jgi:hypothetical protein
MDDKFIRKKKTKSYLLKQDAHHRGEPCTGRAESLWLYAQKEAHFHTQASR